jgi:aspartate aminotransferase
MLQPSATMMVIKKAANMRAQGVDIISFGAGEPDFDTPEVVIGAAVKAMENGKTRYTPGSGTTSLKKSIAHKLKRDNQLHYEPKQIVVSNGAKHSLFNACMTLLQDGDEAILFSPFWVTYPEIVKLAGATPVYVETIARNGFQISMASLEAAVSKNTKLIFVNTPSNPTGAILNKESLKNIVAVAKKRDLIILSDECYEALTYDEPHVSIASLPDAYERTITIQSMSKVYAMTGWRIGYTASSVECANAMAKFQGQATGCPNSIAQEAADFALSHEHPYLGKWRDAFKERRTYMVNALNEIPGFETLMPKGAFYAFPNVSAFYGKELDGVVINSSLDLTNILLEKAHVAVVPGGPFGADDYIRLSYATSMENIIEGINRITKLMNTLS